MTQEVLKNRELVSALADGQLHGEEFARTAEWLAHADDARVTWHAYHLVGDVLRSGETMVRVSDTEFVQRLARKLQQGGPRVSDVGASLSAASYELSSTAEDTARPEKEAANDTFFRWKLFASVASLTVVSVIAWQVWGGWIGQTGAPELAQLQSPATMQNHRPETALRETLVGDQPLVMIRDRQLDALMAAHKQFGGTSALQVPTGFIRNATFEGASP